MNLPALRQSDVDLVVTYSIGSEESVPIAITEAFRAISLNPTDQETVVQDWIDGDALDQLCQASDRHLRISTIIWNHPVIITPREIQIFDNPPDRMNSRDAR